MAIKKLTDINFWRRTGRNARDIYKDIVFEKGKVGKTGIKYLAGKYSDAYKIAKASGKIKRSSGAYRNKVVPVLTGDLQNDFGDFLKPRKDGVQLGFPTQGHKVRMLRKRFGKKGTLTSKNEPLPNKVMNYITSEYSKYIKRNQKNTTRVHKIGRK